MIKVSPVTLHTLSSKCSSLAQSLPLVCILHETLHKVNMTLEPNVKGKYLKSLTALTTNLFLFCNRRCSVWAKYLPLVLK